MGIPSYYTQIIKKYKILQKLTQYDHFYMDANSIIYDVINSTKDFCHDKIIELIIQKLEEYIIMISPTKSVFIAFDGVSPLAKLDQQRQRRFKSFYQNKIVKKFKPEKVYWDTCNITPGTSFMKLLSMNLKSHFHLRNEVIISSSDENGEGEHKIFDRMRSMTFDPLDRHIIYGLDSDLIMISMLHTDIIPELFLFRETPHYIKNIDSLLETNEYYSLNVHTLAERIMIEIDGPIHDYVFFSFMLGNDFLPHFPALNIRTGGIEKLVRAYRQLNKELITLNRTTSNLRIEWNHFRAFIKILASLEDIYIKDEFDIRTKREKYRYSTKTPEDKFRKFENIPSIDREVEKYIDPFVEGWEKRYYETLLSYDSSKVSKDYIMGLSWNIVYYTFGCIDWQWNYTHNYPPLLKDLVLNIPTQQIKWEKTSCVTQMEQLCYVLPKKSLNLIPEEIRKNIDEKWYVDDCTFTWAFCKYFWESHVDLPEIDFMDLRSRIKPPDTF